MKKKWLGALLGAALLAALPALAQQAGGDIGLSKAKDIALSHAGIARPENAFIRKAEGDLENGRRVYEVEFVADGQEYDYEIDAQTGEILAFEGDAQRYQPQAGEITPDQALDIVLERAGLELSQVQAVRNRLELEEGRRTYQIQFRQGYGDYEAVVDADTGTILKWERD